MAGHFANDKNNSARRSGNAASRGNAAQRANNAARSNTLRQGSAYQRSAYQAPGSGVYSNQVRMANSGAPTPAPKPKKNKVPFVILGIVIVLLVAGGISGFMLLNSAKSLKSEASTCVANVDTLKDQIVGGDYEGAVSTAASMQSLASDMKTELNTPLWSVASLLPVVGSDIQGTRTVVGVLDQLSTEVLVPLTTTLQEVSAGGLVQGGAFNLPAIQSLLSVVEETAPVMQACADEMSAVPDMHIEQLQTVMGKAKDKFVSINDLYQTGANLAPLANKLLGGEGTRTYLIVAQNSDEMRSTGGFPGSMGLLTVDNGSLSLGSFGSCWDLLPLSTSVQFSDLEYKIFDAGYTQISQPLDASVFIDFTRTADIWARAYEEQNHVHVDGVVSVVPSMVQTLLTVSGESITLSDGTTMDGSNATKVLEHDLYWKYLSASVASSENNDLCDALFAEAASSAFEKVLSGFSFGSLKAYAEAMKDGFSSGSVIFWLNDEAEQSQIASFNISGALPSNEEEPQIGVYVGVIRASKLGWYLDCDTEVSAATPNPDGSSAYNVTVRLRNTLEEGQVAEAGTYIAGSDGIIDPIMYLTAPAGGTISDVSCSDGTAFEVLDFEGLQLAFNPSTLQLPCGGAETTITYTVTTSKVATSDLTVHTTPLLSQYRQ